MTRLLRHLAVLAIAGVFLTGCLPPAPPPPTVWEASGVITEVNTFRPANPLAVNPVLTNAAFVWADHLARTGVLVHQDLRYVPGAGGEVLLVGPCGISVHDIVQAWMNSPTHESDIMNIGFTQAGAAGACSSDGREWVVMDLG